MVPPEVHWSFPSSTSGTSSFAEVVVRPRRSINPTPDETESKVVRLESSAATKEHKSPFDQANAYIQECRAWRKGNPTQNPPRPFEDYETPVAIKMSEKDWVKLSSELNSEETDEA